MINDLYNYLLQFDDVIKKGDFIGKNNVVYCTETDIRYALRSYVEATNTCEKVLNEILDKVTEEFNSFLGVPESGTFLAFILNQLLYQKRHKDFKINMLRTKPKNYQINTKSPGYIHRQCRSEENQHTADDADDIERKFVGHFSENIGKAYFHIVKVAEQCGKGKQKHRHGNKYRSGHAECTFQRLLDIGGSGNGFIELHSAGKTHQCGSRTQYICINKNRKHLHQTLFDRVRYRSRRRGIGC